MHVRCPRPELHDKHPNSTNTVVVNAWCDGQLVLEPFVELVVRVPLKEFGFDDEMSLAEVVKEIREEGIGTYVIDTMDDPTTRVALRVRWGGEDRVFPVRRRMPEGQGKLW
jgi:hypothetical protein